MKLSVLLEALEDYALAGNPDQDITGLNYDSRKIKKGDLFIAVKGHALDGHGFISSALENSNESNFSIASFVILMSNLIISRSTSSEMQ